MISLPPRRIVRRNRRRVDDHEPAAALGEVLDQRLLLRRGVAAFLRIRDDHVRVFAIAPPSASRCAPSTFIPRSASSVFHSARKRGCACDFVAAIGFAAADEDAERIGGVRVEDSADEREGEEETFHVMRGFGKSRMSVIRGQADNRQHSPRLCGKHAARNLGCVPSRKMKQTCLRCDVRWAGWGVPPSGGRARAIHPRASSCGRVAPLRKMGVRRVERMARRSAPSTGAQTFTQSLRSSTGTRRRPCGWRSRPARAFRRSRQIRRRVPR